MFQICRLQRKVKILYDFCIKVSDPETTNCIQSNFTADKEVKYNFSSSLYIFIQKYDHRQNKYVR